jgi:hypothetical protein
MDETLLANSGEIGTPHLVEVSALPIATSVDKKIGWTLTPVEAGLTTNAQDDKTIA